MRVRQSGRIVPIASVRAHPGNRRVDPGALDELTASVREHGILEPLIVTEHPTELDCWLLLAGERRLAAGHRAELDTVPVIIRHGLDDHRDEQLIVMLVENFQRADLDPIELAEAVGVLRNGGLTIAEIASRSGMSPSRVSDLLALLELDDATRDLVRTRVVSVRDAIDAVRDVRAHHRNRSNRSSGTVKARPRPKAKAVADWLSKTHRLADEARERCRDAHDDGARRRKVGGVACGECWETAIRADERIQPDAPERAGVLSGAGSR